MILAELNLIDGLWFLLVLFFWMMFIIIILNILTDLFRDHEESGAKKVLWVIALILFMPFTALIYLIVRGQGMAERSMKAQKEAQAQMASYVQDVAGTGGPADQIAKAKQLLDSGAIDQAEFDHLKAKALAS
jgi:hypothetical protein